MNDLSPNNPHESRAMNAVIYLLILACAVAALVGTN